MNRIRELRKQKRMTQKELANHLEIADSTLSYWEMGKYEPDFNALKELSRFFHVPIDYILGVDIAEWETLRDRVLYAKTDNSRLGETGSVVNEPKAAYIVGERHDGPAAFNRSEFEGLTSEEINKLAEYAEFIKSLRGKREAELSFARNAD